MERLYLGEISEKMLNQEVLVSGWVQNLRVVGKLAFLILRDWTGLGQVIIRDSTPFFKEVSNLTLESVVSVKGILKESKQSKFGWEIEAKELKIITKAEAPLPLNISGKVESSLDARLDWRPIDLRTPESKAIFRIQAKIVQAMTNYLISNGYLQVFTPCLLYRGAEGGADVFKLDYFGKEAYLRQDPQLHRELSIIGGVEKLFEVGPSFRAEKSFTTRHLCEYHSIAVEQAFIKNERDLERVQEQMCLAAIKELKENCEKELEVLGIELEVPKTPFPELTFPEIYSILEELGKPSKFGEDYGSEQEFALGEYVKEKYGSDFFFVNRFPFAVKPFYVRRVEEDPRWARSIDLIFKGLEISTGGQREHEYERLLINLKEKNINPTDFEWFTKYFKYGVPPLGGFAIGIERFTKQLLGRTNIRECRLFPRDVQRLEP
ncbi:MAG: aspartate--tRNA(Asn) ligase [archaeon]